MVRLGWVGTRRSKLTEGGWRDGRENMAAAVLERLEVVKLMSTMLVEVVRDGVRR